MFWNRKKEIRCTAKGPIFMPPPSPYKRQFVTMLEMIRDAEKYDSKNEMEVSDAILTNLSEFIERYKANRSKS